MIKIHNVRYKINGFGLEYKVVNLYFNLSHISSKDIQTLSQDVSKLRDNYKQNNFWYKVIASAKSMNVWFLEEGTTAITIKAILDDFVSNTALCLLYTQDEKEQYQFLSALLMKYLNAEGADLEMF